MPYTCSKIYMCRYQIESEEIWVSLRWHISRVGQNHIHTVFWQGNHQIYGHIRCIYTSFWPTLHTSEQQADKSSPCSSHQHYDLPLCPFWIPSSMTGATKEEVQCYLAAIYNAFTTLAKEGRGDWRPSSMYRTDLPAYMDARALAVSLKELSASDKRSRSTTCPSSSPCISSSGRSSRTRSTASKAICTANGHCQSTGITGEKRAVEAGA